MAHSPPPPRSNPTDSADPAAHAGDLPRPGPPPLKPFGLILRRDGSWIHEGEPVLHAKLRAVFDRSVRYLPDEDKYIVQIGQFRGEIELEEAGFFVRSIDLEGGRLRISDGSDEFFETNSLHSSPRDGAWLCRIKPELRNGGLLARFTHSAQAELLNAIIEKPDGGFAVELAGAWRPIPDL